MKLKNNFDNALMFLSTILMLFATAIFIILYCNFFDDFGLMAKQRLKDYPFLIFIVTPTLFWVSAYLCRKYSPHAAGHNLQSALHELEKNPNNFSKVSAFLSERLIIVKTISSLIASFGGGALGKEGPSVHMSASIFAIFSAKYKKLLPKINLESWVSAGSAVGLTIVFNAPIAGVVFIVERLSKTKFKNFQQNIFLTLFAVLIVTIIFSRFYPTFIFHELGYITSEALIPLALTAVICGFIAFFFKKITHFSYVKISGIKSNWWHAIPIIAGLMVAMISFYSGTYSFSGGIDTMQKELLSPVAIVSYKEVGGRILNTILTFAAGCAGGLIAPAMAIGSGIGSIASVFAVNVDIGFFLLVGMAAFLSVMFGEFLTAAVIVFEIAGRDIKVAPFLLGAIIITTLVKVALEKVTGGKTR